MGGTGSVVFVMSTPILKKLRADPDTTIDLTTHEPESLSAEAADVWGHFVANTPWWWSEADLLTIERYCYLMGVDRAVRRQMNDADKNDDFDRYQSAWKVMKSLSLELKNVEYALGVSPQGRAALKLDWDPEQPGREDGEGEEPTDPADL